MEHFDAVLQPSVTEESHKYNKTAYQINCGNMNVSRAPSVPKYNVRVSLKRQIRALTPIPSSSTYMNYNNIHPGEYPKSSMYVEIVRRSQNLILVPDSSNS